ncbi:hypothetical protein HAX54_013866 [Datura stramonium]|uniref:Uncharacterized protein n=1 Tax=Datura stramonium TaxID=4076 RepID=A0ABS8Y1Y2_DATST|nr:hypothetical protein [Datura stramonium]
MGEDGGQQRGFGGEVSPLGREENKGEEERLRAVINGGLRGRSEGLGGRRRPEIEGEKKKVVAWSCHRLATAIAAVKREERGRPGLGLVFSGQTLPKTMVEADDKEGKGRGLRRGGENERSGDGVFRWPVGREMTKRKSREWRGWYRLQLPG